MLQKFLATGFAMSMFGGIAQAQDSTKTSALAITGNADVYYRYDFAKQGNNLTSFTNSHNKFELGMASVKFDYKTAKVEMVADLGFGKRAEDFSYTSTGATTAIKQLYLSYSATSWLKFTAGSWATHVGYELVDAPLNRNYSMSYMFTNGPFLHTGVKAEATSGKSGFMLGIANPTDYKYVPDGVMNKKFVLAQYSYAASDAFKLYLNYVGGQGIDTTKSNQFDVVVTSKLSSQFGLGFNGTLNSTKTYLGKDKFADAKSWWGSALYVTYDPISYFGLALRGEYFSDKNQLKYATGTANGAKIFATTLSANFKVENLTLIPEFRLDNASEDIFSKSNGSATKSAASFLIAATYTF